MGNVNPKFVASYFGFELFEYDRLADSILIASGSGLMMAIMDNCPSFKWCLEVDNFRNISHRIPNLITAFDKNCQLNIIAIAGWFSIDNPKFLVEGQKKILEKKSVCYSGGFNVFQNECENLEQFITKVNYGK